MGTKQESERQFHDEKYRQGRRRDFYSYGFTGIIFEDLLRRAGELGDRRVLELGCGEGWLTKLLALRGAAVSSFDISPEAVSRAQAVVAAVPTRHPVRIEAMEAESLGYADGSFDAVIGIAILHHLDLPRALAEIRRVLREGGKGYFMEPLGHNPLLNLFRRLTPGRRSPDERPLRAADLELFRERFARLDHEEYYLTAPFAAALNLVGANGLMLRARDRLHALDRALLRRLPGLRMQCWYTLIEVEK